MSGGVPPSSKAGKRTPYWRNPRLSREVKRAADLYTRFSGHEVEFGESLRIKPLPRTGVCIGRCDGILYTTVRDGEQEKYIHRFKAGDAPLFVVSPDGKQIMLIGGAYDFTERGIVDRSDPTSTHARRRRR